MVVVTDRQIKYIYVLAKQLGMDNNMLHTFLFNRTGQEHISAMTKQEAKGAIDELVRYSGKDKPAKQRGPGMATNEQLSKIRALEYQLGWQNEPKRLKGFIKKYTRIDNIDWLKAYQASNVIEGLKKVLAKVEAVKVGGDICGRGDSSFVCHSE